MRNFIIEVIDEYHILKTLPSLYTEINFTNKPEFPWDFKKIREIELSIPITSSKELVTTTRKLQKFYFFCQLPQSWLKLSAKEQSLSVNPNKKLKLPTDLETFKKIIDKTLPDLSTDLPISDYKKVIPTIDAL
ncbi:33764_t:CDS:1 [Gigaspora margarita]|uniref:33763_t:CDS:1 n=1 Tax=Gigaspora margarita TaxID=4874 RepID=A0ABN7VR79_GIGMA|nr:33763_t:CDS:1 [Gigaspora margarita]CAG8794037.1 33764_t:CDS:1 [Gigaspora margarita]